MTKTKRVDQLLEMSHIIQKFTHIKTWTDNIDKDSWYQKGLILLTRTHGIDKDSWYGQGLMV